MYKFQVLMKSLTLVRKSRMCTLFILFHVDVLCLKLLKHESYKNYGDMYDNIDPYHLIIIL